ncbi:MAG: hypothetical protein ACI97A_000094 [Planctomycetota bacterium]|jgi:hypothetical protein
MAAIIGLIAIGFTLTLLTACGDGPKSEVSTTNSPGSTTKKEVVVEVDPAYLPKTTAIRDGESWRIHVTLPQALPDQAQVEQIICKTDDESHTQAFDPNVGPITFLLGINTNSYEVILIDDQKRSYQTKATFE